MDTAETTKTTNPQIVYTWRAPLRAYKKRSGGVLRFYIALALLLSLIVVFFGDRILVLPIWAIMFLFYVLTITPPPEVENKITTFGVETGNQTYPFDFLSHFYFVKKFDYYVLVVVSHAPYFYHLYLVVRDQQTMHDLIQYLSKHIIYQEHPHKTFTDKLTEWLTKLMPAEDKKDAKKQESEAVPQQAVPAAP